jgi:cob(I)alamin adenosyltransferase
MKIYTKNGDAGETGLFGGVRVSKDDLKIQTYGTFDELNSVLGLVLSHSEVSARLKPVLGRVQSELFQLGSELATPPGKNVGIALIEEAHTQKLENEIDELEKALPALQTFILPGGSPVSALLHLARTVSRRAERALVTLNRTEPQRPEVLQYVNRLSDYLFVCARFANFERKITDIPWIAPKN